MYGLEEKYYRHSGLVGATAVPVALACGCGAALVMAWVYGYAIFYIPLVYLNALLTFGFGMGVGWCSGLGAKLGHARSRNFAMVAGAVSGLFAIYLGWVAWIHALSKSEFLIFSPAEILRIMDELSVEGVWSIHGGTPTGVMLFLIWFAEAAIVISASALTARLVVSRGSYCEECRRWLGAAWKSRPVDGKPMMELPGLLESGDFTVLLSLEPVAASSPDYRQIELSSCPSCNKMHLLTVKRMRKVVGSDKKEKTETQVEVDRLLVPAEIIDRMHQQFT